MNASQVASSDKALDYYSAVLITVSESFIALAIEYLDPVQNGVEWQPIFSLATYPIKLFEFLTRLFFTCQLFQPGLTFVITVEAHLTAPLLL